jgi:predicted metal-binding membrane protein
VSRTPTSPGQPDGLNAPPWSATLARAGGLGDAFAAVRLRLGLVLVLFAIAGAGWWWTVREMAGMDLGPWTALGSSGWFVVVWTVMMAAMMLPSVAPTVALYSRMARGRWLGAPLAFTAGYLLVWVALGVVALLLEAAAGAAAGDALSWERAGRPFTVATLLVAAVYEFTPLKDVCLGKCRSPLGFLLGAWRDGWRGALRMGARHGAWCLGCCWALMAALFALGVMSVVWMALVAALIALEKTLPWRRAATWSTAAVLVGLALLVLTAPDAVPGLTHPDTNPMPTMMPVH